MYKRGITTKTGSKALAPVWKGPFLVVHSNPPLYKIQDRKCRVFTIHHDRLKICKDRLLPIWLHQHRHDLLNLDSSIIYEDSDTSVLAESQGQGKSVPTSVVVPEGDIEQEDEAPLAENARLDTLDSRDLDETLPYSQGVPISNPMENADLDARSDTLDSRDLDETLPYSQGVSISNPMENADLGETLPHAHGVPSPNMNSDLDQTLPHSKGQPNSDNAQTTDLVPTEDLLQGGVLPKLFKLPKVNKPLTLGVQGQLPSKRGREIKPPSHLSDYVCK